MSNNKFQSKPVISELRKNVLGQRTKLRDTTKLTIREFMNP